MVQLNRWHQGAYTNKETTNLNDTEQLNKSKNEAVWDKIGRAVSIVGLGVTITALVAIAALATYVAVNALLAGAAVIAIALPFVVAGVCLASAGGLSDLAKRVANEYRSINNYYNDLANTLRNKKTNDDILNQNV